MNLFDMASRGDRNLSFRAATVTLQGAEKARTEVRRLAGSGTITASKRAAAGHTWRGFDVEGEAGIVVHNALRWYPFCERPADTGWYVMALDAAAVGTRVHVRVVEPQSEQVLASADVVVSREPQVLPLPRAAQLDANLELSLQAGPRARVFVAVHKVLDRQELLARCRGTGVELGPGPHPQVRPGPGVDVAYVEQSSPADWQALYNEKGKYDVEPALWERYRIGEAHDLPVADGTLDFIFSSHVFEHLANPLGHLSHWHAKLRPGGVVAAIVPDTGGCKDYVYRPCSLADLIAEHEAGGFAPTLAHYVRWAEHRAPGKDPAEFLRAKRSIHVHFYSLGNMNEVLEYAVGKLGFAEFRIWHSRNHKDFFFLLRKR